MNINIFIISYLILGFFLSVLISFLFLRQYAYNNNNFKFAYYFNIIVFALSLYHILISSLDLSLSRYENFPNFKKEIIEKLFDILPIYYLIIDYLPIVILIFTKLYYYISTSGFFLFWDIICDAFSRAIYLEKETLNYINKKTVSFGSVLLVLIFLNTKKKIISLKTCFDVFKIVSNIKNFFPYITFLFYIGFIIQHFYIMFKIEYDDSEKQNHRLWKLGKIYVYYDKERDKILKEEESIGQMYENNFSDVKKELLDEEDKKVLEMFEKKYEDFRNYIDNLKINSKIMNFKIENIDEAIETFRKEVYDNFIEENKQKGDSQKLYHITEGKEKELVKLYTERIFKLLDKECNCDCKYICIHCFCCCLRCCCCNSKKNYYKQQIINNICYKMSKVYEKCISFKRKYFLMDLMKKDIIKINRQKNKCCRCKIKYLLYFLIVLVILFFFEIPELSDEINIDSLGLSIEIKFIITIGLYIFLITFYFFIFSYGILYNNYIQGNALFGKNEYMSDGINFFNFSKAIGLFTPVIFHVSWLLNKKGNINTKFNKIFVLPDYDLEISEGKTINLLEIMPIASLGLIIIFTFIATKFSKLSIFGLEIFIFNENSGFYDDDEKFYGYLFIGCGCLIDLYKENKNEINSNDYTLIIKEEEENLIN